MMLGRGYRGAGVACGLAVLMAGSTVRPADGGAIEGRLTEGATGRGIGRVVVRAFEHGRSVAREALTEGDGSYVLRDLPGGNYAVCTPPGEMSRPVSVGVVEVRDGETTKVDLKAGRSFYIEGDSWVQSYPSFSQSFRACGLGVTMVGVKAFGESRNVGVQLREGDDPGGRAIGPVRTTRPVGGEATEVVWWAGGEAATVPGQMYTLEMSAKAGEVWIAALAGRGDVYPSGSAHFDGSPRPLSDLGLLVCEDNDGMRTDYAVGPDWRTCRATSMGQSFVALSERIRSASAILSGVSGPPVYARFSIHEGGPGGRQIGPSKGVQVSENAAVAWGPDEVPVTPGQAYYLHIESFSGLTFLASVQRDTYRSGQAVFDGRPSPERDLCAMVTGWISQADFGRLVGHPEAVEAVALANASFEEGASSWHRMNGDTGSAVGCDGGVVPMWGGRMFGWTNEGKGGNSRPTIYQQVKAVKGARYCFSGSVYTDHEGGRSSDVKVRLVVAPGGGTALRDYEYIDSSQWYATEGQWCRGSVEFVAEADVVTVGFELEQRFDLARSSVYVDGAYLERLGAN